MSNPSPERRPNLEDIARSLGVSAMTVSRALRGAGGVGEALRKRVKAEARRIGYRADPALAVLNAYRHRLRRPAGLGQIAFLTQFETEDGWRKMAYIERYFEGAQAHASRLGYALEPFWLTQPGLSPARASSILWNRGVRGVLIAPLQRSDVGTLGERFRWERFTMVALGPSLIDPVLDHTVTNFRASIILLVEKLRERGYRRIGLAISAATDRRFRHEITDTFWGEQRRHPEIGDLPPICWEEDDAAVIREWHKRHRPDAIISQRPCWMIDRLAEACRGRPPPVYYLSLYSTDGPELAGMEEDLEDAGRHAIDRLHGLLLLGRKGAPESPLELRFQGRWRNINPDWPLCASPRRA